MTSIVNAAPLVVDLGTRDLSVREVPFETLKIPQHLPKVYIFAEKGPVGPTYIDFDMNTLVDIYGEATFDVTKKYYTHQTPFLELFASNSNNCVVHRLIPSDAKDVANVTIYLDVLPTYVPLYQKNTDGSLVLDTNGDPVPVLDSNNNPITVAGYKVGFVTDFTVAPTGTYQIGLKTIRAGVQTDGVNQSQQYPIFEFSYVYPGEYGNSLSVKLYPALQSDITTFPTSILNDSKVYPFYFQFIDPFAPITGAVLFSAKQNFIDPNTRVNLDLNNVISKTYYSLLNGVKTSILNSKVYYDNLELLLQQFYDAEKNLTDPYRDPVINNTENNIHAINFISFTSSNGSPYQSIKLVDFTGSVRLTKNTKIFLRGADDGTINNAVLDQLVELDTRNYLPTSSGSEHEYMDQVLHPESIIYDSGFTLNTKIALMRFISKRKDTYVALSTYSHDTPYASLSMQQSIGITLKTAIELYPESDTFGTPVMRGVVFVGSGTIINHKYQKRIPFLYELADKASKFMGAKNGAWRAAFAFDRAPNSVVTKLENIDIRWVPAATRNNLWAIGLNFPLNYSINRQFIPAIQTVYENDTSVLNSFFTTVAISYLNKVAHACHREFSGSVSLTNDQLIEKVNNFVENAVKDKFAGFFVIKSNAHITEMDALRGFSWTLAIKIYANNMKSVMTTYVEAYNMESLNQ